MSRRSGFRSRPRAWIIAAIAIAKFVDALYVLHAFQKKTQRTARSDLELATWRYKLIGRRR